jgi:hypothetical protein
MGNWAKEQDKLKSECNHLWDRRSRGLGLSPNENSRLEELPKEYFEVCKGEAKEDMEKGYLHQLTDVYVEASGTIQNRLLIQENLLHAMRRATTLSARLGYDTARLTEKLATQNKRLLWLTGAIIALMIAQIVIAA